MKQIWKYEIEPGENTLNIPGWRGFISAGIDPKDNLCVWALIDDQEEEDEVNLWVVGTGWDIGDLYETDDAVTFIGSVKDGCYMWHVFGSMPEEDELNP